MATQFQDDDALVGKLTQDRRVGILETPLGKDALVLVRFNGTEQLGQLFDFQIEAISETSNLDFTQAIGKHCTLTFKTYGSERMFDGMLTEAQWIGVQGDFQAYRLTLRPWLWMLSQRADCRIFQNKSVVDIIKKVFDTAGFSDYRTSLSDYPKIKYCVQYRESDLAFVSRLMEQYGIYYFFEHEKGKHTVVLADSASSHKAVPGAENITYLPAIDRDHRDFELLLDWSSERRFRAGKFVLNDYDYENPNKDLKANASGKEQSESQYEVYDYPGKYTDPSEGNRFVKVRLEATQALDHRRYAAGDAMSLFPGGLTTLQKHPEGGENQKYLVLRASHSFGVEDYRTGGGGGGERIYHGHYQFLPADVTFRSPLVTPRPVIHGSQTAKVVEKPTDEDGTAGSAGEEIDVDGEHGRIWVHFYWERKNLTSCPVRVAQLWSGKKWGGQYIPRVGQEVVVDFLEGDPDRPLVVGTVYNGDNKYPYALPDQKTVGGIKTDSTKNGGGGYNELNFEDKKNSEQIGMHAEKDLKIVVLNSETREIGERFIPPMGSPSRATTLKNGDDNLTLQMGSQTITISLGSQTVSAFQAITLSVGPLSSVSITPASISLTSPTINLTAMTAINLTAPTINLTGVVNIVGGLTVNTMVPVLVPA